MLRGLRPGIWQPLSWVRHLFEHAHLVRLFTVRDAVGRYRGSVLGLLWSFFNPLLMLAVYSIFFGELMGADADAMFGAPFALGIFCGMTVYGVFQEVLTRTPDLIAHHGNYVKRVVFPLEILPGVVLGSAFIHGLISLGILLLGQVLFGSGLHATVLLLPLVLVPLGLISLGLGFFLAGLGAYVRDVGMSIAVVSQVLFFLSPVIYSPHGINQDGLMFRVLQWNPLTFAIESARNVILRGVVPDLWILALWTILGLVVSHLGFLWFQKVRGGFADVL